MATQLYPPIISDRIPAFYIEDIGNGAETKNLQAAIIVPFSMNKAVKISEITGFSLKIKTVQTGKIITTINDNTQIDVDNLPKQIKFMWNNNSDISEKYIGQFLKIQMAYIGENEVVGLYSDVSIVKCTAKPTVYIEEFENNNNDNNTYPAFNYTYTGIYKNEDDVSEKPYLYNFILYKSDETEESIIEESGWQLYDLNDDIEKKVYTFSPIIDSGNYYKIEYKIRTINNLEVKNEKEYKCTIPVFNQTNILQLNIENIFEEGYINLSLSSLGIENTNYPIKLNLYRKNKYSTDSSILLQKFELLDEDSITEWNFKDFTVEQGVTYIYFIVYEYSSHTDSFLSKDVEITADFEDMFLWDGEKQIKIRFNPKVSSFKINQQEQKVETIGSSFPMFFKNGKIHYKEFPISGLISYHLDKNELFVSANKDLKIILDKNLERLGTPEFSNDINDSAHLETLNSLNYNIHAERQFKLKLLEWLNDGKVKLFKSPTEGNYLIRLLNVSLSPEDKLGRMLHSFSCIAYEVDEYSYNNLIKNGLITLSNSSEIPDLSNFIFKTQTIYGEDEQKNISISESNSLNKEETSLKKKQNILIFKNKKLTTIRDFKQKLLYPNDDNIYYMTDSYGNIITVFSAIQQTSSSSPLIAQDIVYSNLTNTFYYYWIQQSIDSNNGMITYALCGSEEFDHNIQLTYTIIKSTGINGQTISNTQTISKNISNLSKLVIIITYKDIDNYGYIDKINIIEFDRFNNRKTIQIIPNENEENVKKIIISNITLPNGVYLERIESSQDKEGD